MLTISTNSLRAALHCVATKDIRYYLNGVCLQITEKASALYVVATNGHILFASRQELDWTDEPKAGPWTIIIPTDTVKAALNQWRKLSNIPLLALPDGNYQLGSSVLTPIDGKFPDWNRVIPRDKMNGEAASFDPRLMLRAHKALADFTGNKSLYADVSYNGPDNAALLIRGQDCLCVVMPWKSGPAYKPFRIDTDPLAQPVAIAA